MFPKSIEVQPMGSFCHMFGSTPPSASKTGPSHAIGRILSQSSSSIPISRGTAFRLQPRGKPIATPSPDGKAYSRGRKRNAQCLHLSSCVSRDLSYSERSPSSTTESTPKENDPRTNLTFECAMQSLSIQSPKVTTEQRPVKEVASTTIIPPKSRSSFDLYSSGSPHMGPPPLRPRGGSISSCGSSSIFQHSSASVKSASPKLAPLTLLHTTGSCATTKSNTADTMIANVGISATPTKQRPPRHGVPSSSLLYSLDSTPSCGSYGDSVRQGRSPISPHRPPAFVEYTPEDATTTTSSSTKECSQLRSQLTSPLSRRITQPAPETPESRLSIRSAHETPLPNIKLTPRSTPRGTPLSDGYLSTFLSPTARELGLMDKDILLPYKETLETKVMYGMDSDDGDDDDRDNSSPPYVPRKDGPDVSSRGWVGRTPAPTVLAPCEFLSQSNDFLPRAANPRSVGEACRSMKEDETTPTSADMLSEPSQPPVRHNKVVPIRTTSLLGPPLGTPAIFSTMQLGRPRDRNRMFGMGDGCGNIGWDYNFDDSLSDPDDDELFVLTNPAVLVEERMTSGPVRQRQRLSYSSLDDENIKFQARPSTTSLRSTYASNTSLLGVDFVRGDSTASLLSGMATSAPRSLPSFVKVGTPKADEEQFGMSLGLSHSSAGSFASIGLALEPSTLT